MEFVENICHDTGNTQLQFDDVLFPVWTWECCRISPPRFLAKCRKKRLNQDGFVLLWFVLFVFFLGCV